MIGLPDIRVAHIALLLCCWGAFQAWTSREVVNHDGILVDRVPVQSEFHGAERHFSVKDYDVEALAEFKIEARVLSVQGYYFDAIASLVPVDFALGWGAMSSNEVLRSLQIRQTNRWWMWETQGSSLTTEEIGSQAANMHMIPANPRVRKALKAIRVGQIIKIDGLLVRATNKANGMQIASSLSRTDTGAGACEVIYVKSLTVRNH